jgi:pimeloyl-ACP methyl ester carboxylesterase
LAVARLPASRPEERIGTMFFNPGGPGEAGAQFLKDPDSAQLLDDAGQGRFDVISWDPRGTGESSPVRCFRSKRSETRSGATWPFPRRERSRFGTSPRRSPTRVAAGR